VGAMMDLSTSARRRVRRSVPSCAENCRDCSPFPSTLCSSPLSSLCPSRFPLFVSLSRCLQAPRSGRCRCKCDITERMRRARSGGGKRAEVDAGCRERERERERGHLHNDEAGFAAIYTDAVMHLFWRLPRIYHGK